VRWTEKHNMEEFLRLVSLGRINVKELITHVFDFSDTLKAYDIITGKIQEKYLAILLKYNVEEELSSSVTLVGTEKPKLQKQPIQRQVNVGIIGAGNFATGVLLPKLGKIESARIKCIVTATGLTAAHIGKKYGCDYVNSDYREIVKDLELDAVVVVTRHNLHSLITSEALKHGKYVFVEKPLAISMEQLESVIKARNASDGEIMVGFNRRFAPLAGKVKDHFLNRTYPISINYRVNAGSVSKDSWLHDPEEGGGRIIGEVCHFVDFLQYIVGCYPSRVYAEILEDENQNMESADNVSVILNYPDGSMGTINYLSNGDPKFPKERIEIFGGNSICVIDDFRHAEIHSGGKIRKSGKYQDKGHESELREFVKVVKNGEGVPVDFQEAVAVTITTFKILESVRSRLPVKLNLDQ